MSTVRDLHDQAMALFGEAENLAQKDGVAARVLDLYNNACDKESEAASMLDAGDINEPTRSILFISAATLALKAKDLRRAERLSCDGLRGYPSIFHYKELHTLLEQATFERHLEVQGKAIDEAELQLSLSGPAAGAGYIMAGEFERRIKNTDILFKRLYMYHLKMDYVSDLRKKSDGWYADSYNMALATPQVGSFAVRIKLVRPLDTQLKLTDQAVTPQKVIQDLIQKMNLLQNGLISELKDIFQNESYLKNFLVLAREIMPDGRSINLVSLSSSDKSVTLNKQKEIVRQEIKKFETGENKNEKITQEIKEIVGTMDEARRGVDKKLTITTKIDGQLKPVEVRLDAGLEDIVRSYFGMEVRATGIFKKKKFIASDIIGMEDV